MSGFKSHGASTRHRSSLGAMWVVTASLVLWAFACDSADQADEADQDELRSEIMQLIGEAPAGDRTSCRTIAFGSKPCGGPWSYLVFSVEHTDSAELARLVDRYNELEAALNMSEGRSSDCSVPSRPETTLSGGQCTAVE